VTDDVALVERCRAEARALQHGLRADDAAVARRAAVRLARLPKFADVDLGDLVRDATAVTRAEALDAIAGEHDFRDWAALVAHALPELRAVPMHEDRMGAFLNRWFVDYDEAAASRRAEGGYLLPYRRQFFVTTADAVRELGLDPDDPDWARIGFDWVRPLDVEAHLRLCRVRQRVVLARG
jgi:hypothetical protein